MPLPDYTRSYNIFCLVIPSGISQGFATIALPYLLTHAGFTVAETGAIVAVGVSANLWRFLWGPVADLTLSLRKWFWIGVIASVLALICFCVIPFNPKHAIFLTVILFVSQIAATFILLPVGSYMANRIQDHEKGRAAGWYQAGNLGGMGLGGGVGLWLATHYSVTAAGVGLGCISLLFALASFYIKDLQSGKEKIITEIMTMGKNIASMVRIPVVLFAMILICLPIGAGGVTNLWSAIANDWKTDTNTVVLITGIINGLVSAVGCVLGGWIADKWGVWKAYLGFGLICSAVLLIVAFSPMVPWAYISGVLGYAFGLGMMNAAFSAVLLFAIGKKNAATKYSMLSSLGNLPVVFMTWFDGKTHDWYNSKIMLIAEAMIAVVFVILAAYVINRLKAKNLLLQAVE